MKFFYSPQIGADCGVVSVLAAVVEIVRLMPDSVCLSAEAGGEVSDSSETECVAAHRMDTLTAGSWANKEKAQLTIENSYTQTQI